MSVHVLAVATVAVLAALWAVSASVVVVDVEFAVTDVERAAGYDGWAAPDAWKRTLQKCIHDATGAAVGDGALTAVRWPAPPAPVAQYRSQSP